MVVVRIVFICNCAGNRVFNQLITLFIGMKHTCTDANGSWFSVGPRGREDVCAASCRQGPLRVVFVCNYARANIDLDCCPSGQLHCVALCSESVGLGEQSARGKVNAKATVVVVMLVFICICTGLSFFRQLVALFFGLKLTCIDATDSWLWVNPKSHKSVCAENMVK